MTREHYGSNFVSPSAGPGTVRVPVNTIDGIMRAEGLARVDFVKMDVEGYEYQALQGAIETFRNSDPVLLVEITDNHPGWKNRRDSSPEQIAGLPEPLGYPWGVFDDDGRFFTSANRDGARMACSYHNYVFARDLERVAFD